MNQSNIFRTEISIIPPVHKFSLQSRILTAGSCFAEVMGNKMAAYKVPSLINPFGTIFNPLSLFKLLAAALHPQQPFTGELLQRDKLWFVYDLHSSFAAPTKEQLLSKIQETLEATHAFLKEANCLILTFGTAVGYVHKASNTLVANCHKVPQQQFEKKLISITDLLATFGSFYANLQKLNPNVTILVTVSPVRHLKETLEFNSVSKALLRVACHEIATQYPEVHYFPAYELMLDDLRDYRFYKADMIHPTEVAETYIWQKFKEAYYDAAFQQFTTEWDKIQQALAHKPFHPELPAHQQFLQNLLAKVKQLHQIIDCTPELEKIKMQLI